MNTPQEYRAVADDIEGALKVLRDYGHIKHAEYRSNGVCALGAINVRLGIITPRQGFVEQPWRLSRQQASEVYARRLEVITAILQGTGQTNLAYVNDYDMGPRALRRHMKRRIKQLRKEAHRLEVLRRADAHEHDLAA